MLLHDFFDFYAREYPDSDFAVQGDRRIRYGEARDQVNRLANALVGFGLQPGDRFAILSKNSIEYATVYYAASKAGVVPVPLNYRLAPPELAYIINDAQAKMLMASSEYVEATEGLRGALETVGRFVSIGGAGPSGWEDYQSLIDTQPQQPPQVILTGEDDLLQMYTSGTTGRPKGAVLTHSNVTTNVAQCSGQIELSRGDQMLIVAPMYHLAAAFCTFAAVARGGCLYVQEEFNPMEVVRVLSEGNISWALLVPAMIQACLVAVPDVAERNYDNLKTMGYGASPIAEGTLRRAMEVFKCEFMQAFGMTELSPIATLMSNSDHLRGLGSKPELLLSAGRPIPGTTVRIVDEDDNPVPNGTMGELVVGGPQVMKGYWNLPEETAEALRGGWMHTGDAGTMDDEGYVYIQDRVKDMIVSGGENVYPRTVEEVLFKHAAVADAAVFGVPDQQWGETVKAVVVLREGASATDEEIIEYCRNHLGGFELPRSVDFIPVLPRNASGKVLKRELREPYWEGHGRRVAGA